MPLSEEKILENVKEGLKNIVVDDVSTIDTQNTVPIVKNDTTTTNTQDTTKVVNDNISTTDTVKDDPIKNEPVKQDNIISGVSKPDEPATKADGEPSTLSDAFRRAAVHQGWKPNDIDDFYESNPELAERTFAKIHETTNNLSKHWAEAGKVALGREAPVAQLPVQPVVPQSTINPTEFVGIDMNKLKQDFEGDPILDQVVAPLNDALVRLHQSFDTLKGQVNTPQVVDRSNVITEEQTLIGKQTDQFFTDPSMVSYKELYGEGGDWLNITGRQANERMRVLNMADQIITGAALQNEKLSNEDGLLKAHLMVSAPHKEAMVRAEINNTIAKRSDNITLQPSSAPAPENSNKQLTDNEIEAKVKHGLSKAFNTN